MEDAQDAPSVSNKDINIVLTRLKVLSSMTEALLTDKEDVTVSVMKSLAYLKPIPGLSYLNGMFDILKDLVFHLHSVQNRNKTLSSAEFSQCTQNLEQDLSNAMECGGQVAKLLEVQLKNIVHTCLDKLAKITRESKAPVEINYLIMKIKPCYVVNQMLNQRNSDKIDMNTGCRESQQLALKNPCFIKGALHKIMQRNMNCNNNAENVMAKKQTNAENELSAWWHSELYLESAMKYKTKFTNELNICKGQTVKQKLESSDGTWAFGWKRSLIGSKKVWGFFPSMIASKRAVEGDYNLPLLLC